MDVALLLQPRTRRLTYTSVWRWWLSPTLLNQAVEQTLSATVPVNAKDFCLFNTVFGEDHRLLWDHEGGSGGWFVETVVHFWLMPLATTVNYESWDYAGDAVASYLFEWVFTLFLSALFLDFFFNQLNQASVFQKSLRIAQWWQECRLILGCQLL